MGKLFIFNYYELIILNYYELTINLIHLIYSFYFIFHSLKLNLTLINSI